MEEELKTLNELEEYYLAHDGHTCPKCRTHNGGHELNQCSCTCISIEDLKDEAQKWIKKMKKDIPLGKTPKEVTEIIIAVNGSINFIKHFFNLDDE